MNNKVGIVTFHKACNYGAVLQTYALQRKLQEVFNNDDVKVIDYYCPAIEDRTSPFYLVKDGNPIKNILRFIYLFFPKYKKYRVFSDFRQTYLCETGKKYENDNFSSLDNEFNVIFVGSDQVWNLKSTGNDKNYFLNQIGDNTLKCSYAASFGFTEIVHDYYDDILPLVKRFDYISLRENIGIEELFNKNGLSAVINVDPTMLLNSSDWDCLVKNEKRIDNDYILLYCVLKTKKLISFTKQLSRQTGLPVYSISNHSDYSDFIQLKSASVEEFVSLIKNAKYVITTSFHGTVFSILYHKQFVTELDTVSHRNTRVENLINILSLENRSVDSDDFDIDNCIDWKIVDSKVESNIRNAEEYLYSIKNKIEGAKKGE